MRALRTNCVSPGSLKAIGANRDTDRACPSRAFLDSGALCSLFDTPSASGCPHRVRNRRSDNPPITSGLARSTDIIRQSMLVRLVPTGDLDRWLREPSCEDVTLEHRYLKLMSQLRRAIDRLGEPARMATLAKSVENGSARMRWFRDHSRRGSWLALVALAVNISLSFGHIHAIDGRGLHHRSASEIAAAVSPDDGQTLGHHDGDRVDLLCPICMEAVA
jgi:hypothetical protein